MNSEAVAALIAKNPSLKASKSRLEAMEPGAYCIHRSWGFGQIKQYDPVTQKLLIDFAGKKAHPMEPAFCLTTLEILPPKHLLVRQQTEPKVINDLIAENPAQLIAEALEAYPGNATTAIDLEITLTQVLGAEKFKKWWVGAKKAVSKDPRIAVPVKKIECYVLRETPISSENELIESFGATRSARRRILLAEKLVAGAAKDYKGDLKELLASLAEAVSTSNQLSAAERLHGASVRDNLAKLAGVDAATFTPAQTALVSNVRDLPGIAEKVSVHFQSHLLELVKTAHPGEYRDIVFMLLKTSQGKFTTECINFLMEQGHADDLAAALKRWQVEQNLRAPVLLWVVKNRHTKKFAKLLHDLITPRLLGAIFFAIDYEALQAATARRIPLADILSEDPDLISDLLSTADPETARDLANTLLLNQGFEELTKKSLLARFIKIFPKIQALVAGDAESKEEQLLVSRESFERKRDEYELIVSKKIPENSRAIAAAREHGDLRENAEYKMCKDDQRVLMAQKAQLEKELGRARITDFKEATIEQVSVGSVVDVVISSTGQTARYTVLGAWDSVPDRNIIAYKTPLGLALLGKKPGDKVTVKIGGAEESYAVAAIARHAV